MRIAFLALLLSTTAAAQTLPQCADSGESSSTRSIRPVAGSVIKVGEVPEEFRSAAIGRSLRFHLGAKVPDDVYLRTKVSAARRYHFSNGTTFYLLTVDEQESIFSKSCPDLVCSSDWWDTTITVLADAERPPAGVPGDEWYLRAPNDGPITLLQADPFSEPYDLTQQCILRAFRTTK
jgi:hypothetical protein